MEWSAVQYARFLDDRTRPARDLLAAVPITRPALVVDVGCGPGNSTALLAGRYPSARVLGLDPDPDMLHAARAAVPEARFEQGSIENWQPPEPPDLIFANASLQWVADHAVLFPRLVAMLRPGGVLAVQMPDNLDEPSHVAMRRVARDPRWADRLAEVAGQRAPLMTPVQLLALLGPLCRRLDIWRTTYQHEMEGLSGIGEWFKGSALRPFLQRLETDEQAAFMAEWQALIAPDYPQAAGRVLLPFPRAFFVAIAA